LGRTLAVHITGGCKSATDASIVSVRENTSITARSFWRSVSTETNKLESKYSGLLGDVNKLADETEKRMLQQNFYKIKADAREEDEMEE
jgi:hypothetical protein